MTTLTDNYKIITETYEEGWIWKIKIQDPIYGKWHEWEESDEILTSETEARVAAERFIDNYEPDEQISRESDERMSFREQMAQYQRLK